MKNKFIAGVILLTMSSLAFASGDKSFTIAQKDNYFARRNNIKYFSGVYLGVGAGINVEHGRSMVTYDEDSKHRHYLNLDIIPNAKLSIGYGKAFTVGSLGSALYLGGELFGQFFSYGADVKLGYFLTSKTMVYALAGTRARYCHGLHNLGLMPGIGIETMLTKKLSLSGQYTYTNYDHNDTSQGAFTVGLAYHFNGI